ncbi:uncharacterized protein F4822DRAFT_407593 [Hypoxylon trugodes]|uniref:uncharacterized protein n=1 Tax=Hypoxylon trugodes TaxID=326681 RepID=UPI00218F1A06|nr:uncharacterized protein F4822DRAFT_407593 [Hypoxylon trugodes]KAI1387794.1 hypothetical protein F4822DRAFT_407593 [Hypoxylon trugodes]
MVSHITIREANTRFSNRQRNDPGRVCVFAGATSGIGASTLERLTCVLSSPTIYIIGRSAKRFAAQQARLYSLNRSCRIVFLQAQVSLLADVDTVCKKIANQERAVDYLFMSPGLIPINGPEYTKEGLEICFAMSYYARMRLIHNLLPLLRRSSQPRILSVLNGGKEKQMRDDDIGLEKHWSSLAVVGHSSTMTSLSFDYLAKQNPKMVFLHTYPGWVKTDNFARLEAPPSSGILWVIFLLLLRSLTGILASLFGFSSEQCAERQVFYLTSERYTPGAWRIDHNSETAGKNRMLDKYRQHGWPERIWEHTARVFEKTLFGSR